MSIRTTFDPVNILRGLTSAPALYGIVITLIFSGKSGWLLPQIASIYDGAAAFYSLVGGWISETFDFLVFWADFELTSTQEIAVTLYVILAAMQGAAWVRAVYPGKKEMSQAIRGALIFPPFYLAMVFGAASQNPSNALLFWWAMGFGMVAIFAIALCIRRNEPQEEFDLTVRANFIASATWSALFTALPFAVTYAVIEF